MNLKQSLESFYIRAQDFVVTANNILPSCNKMFFSGDIYSGILDHPEVLFLSINPGFSIDDWESVQRNAQINNNAVKFDIKPCKYNILDPKEKFPLASKITSIILNGDNSKYDKCGETYLKSFYATPTEGELKKQLQALPPELMQEHNNIMLNYVEFLLNNISSKNIICIGMNVFQNTIDILGINAKDVKLETYKTSSGKDRVFYKSIKHKNTLIHGILHLSACHISTVGINNMREIFKKSLQFT